MSTDRCSASALALKGPILFAKLVNSRTVNSNERLVGATGFASVIK